MTDEPVGPLDADLDALLEAERGARPPAGAIDRVWTRVGAATAAAGRGQGGDGDRANDLAPGSSRSRWIASHAVHAAAVAFVAGGAVGAGLHATLRKPPPERVVYVYSAPPPVASSAPAAIATPSVASAPEAPSSAPSAPAPNRPTAPATPAGLSTLSAERLLLDDARAALTAGEPSRALSLLQAHARRFGRPQLGEEREALAVQALVAVGRYGDARARAARFRAAAPNSLFLPAVDATLASIP